MTVRPVRTRERDEALYRALLRTAYSVGVFRRRVRATPELATFKDLADELANNIEAAFGLLDPTAGEIVAQTYPGDPETADAALEVVDARAAYVRRLTRGR